MDITVKIGKNLTELLQERSGGPYDFVAVHGNYLALAEDTTGLEGARLVHGATSCLGAMTDAGATTGLAAFAISDPDGAYGTALKAFEGDPKSAAKAAVQAALQAAGRAGEQPDLVWVSVAPGQEEHVLAGIEAVVGTDTPIIGGSAADNAVTGDWFVFDQGARVTDGVVVSILFASARVSFAYQNGYSPTSHQGIVTRSDGRTIHEINGRRGLHRARRCRSGDPFRQHVLAAGA